MSKSASSDGPAEHQRSQEPSQPLVGSSQKQDLKSLGLVLTYGALYCGTSAGQITYNKYLMHQGRFPYAVPLVLVHTIFCTVLAGLLFLVRPSLFPSLSGPVAKMSVDRNLLIKGALPIAVCFSMQLAMSNTAYLHSSVAFLQMMKEGNLVLVYLLSLAFALERFSWPNLQILFVIIIATTLTIHGEVHFSLTGFAIQGTGQLFECMKIVLQAMLLSAAGRKLDALSYVLLVMPLCLLVLSVTTVFMSFFVQSIAMPSSAEVVQWLPHLVLNACMAFTLNVIIALFVKNSSAVAFILAGIVKDAGIVLVSGFFLQETISTMQAVGFAVQLGGILVYSLRKTMASKESKESLAAPIHEPQMGVGSKDYGSATLAVDEAC